MTKRIFRRAVACGALALSVAYVSSFYIFGGKKAVVVAQWGVVDMATKFQAALYTPIAFFDRKLEARRDLYPYRGEWTLSSDGAYGTLNIETDGSYECQVHYEYGETHLAASGKLRDHYGNAGLSCGTDSRDGDFFLMIFEVESLERGTFRISIHQEPVLYDLENWIECVMKRSPS